MAIRLTAWLEEICATQLLLGNHWLNDRNKVRDEYRQTGVKLDPDRDWEGLYHDNGSCLDITNDIPPGPNCYLTVSKLTPLQLSDGHSQLPAHIAPACAAKLFPRPPRLWDSILVRRYTLRYTSYGPPRLKLALIVESAAWAGDQHAIDQPDITKIPLLRSEELSAAFRRLDETRAAEDHRCLGNHSRISEGANFIPSAMDHPAENSQNASQAHTQYAFGTQMPRQKRSLPREDEPQVLSVKRLEPVLAGNTQREDIPPRAATSRANPTDLLRLLNRHQAPAANAVPTKSSNTPPQNALQKTPRKLPQKPRVPTDVVGTQMQTQLPVHVDRHSTQIRGTQAGTSPLPAQTRTSRSPMQTTSTRPISPTHSTRSKQQAASVSAVQEAEASHLQTLASECTWMHGMEFTRESFRIPYDQMSLLRSDSSWHKPLPGHRFPDGNVPIGVLTTLHRMADETAALEAAPDSDEEMYEDPSPEFPVETVDPSPATAPEPSQDVDVATSQVSWSPSPSPVPPQLVTGPNHQLPPDSSFEVAHIPDVGGVKDNILQAIPVESSNEEDKADEQHVPPSSPPGAFDDDMEMEEYVPQGLGEDSVGGATEMQPNSPPPASPPPDSVVQVHETPYVKGKVGQSRAGIPSPSTSGPLASETAKQTSSLSIVHGTYNDRVVSDKQEQAVSHDADQSGAGSRENGQLRQREPDKDELERQSEARHDRIQGLAVHDHAIGKVVHAPSQRDFEPTPLQLSRLSLMHDVETHERPGTGGQRTRKEADDAIVLAPQTPTISEPRPKLDNFGQQATNSVSPVPGRVKRKHKESPTKRNGRHSKRREIKIVGFGDDLPDSGEPVSATRSYHEDHLRQFPEHRISSTIPDHRSTFPGETEGRDIKDAMQINSFGAAEGDAPAPGRSPRHESLYEDPSEAVSKAAPVSLVHTPALSDEQVYIDTAAKEPVPRAASLNSSSVFHSFKAVYPEYNGDAKHFEGQCRQMIQLDEDDKMVPKWQWDDYIIRNRTDYKEYALQCVEQGGDPQPYSRFYKDSIGDTLYNNRVIASRAILLQALHELNDWPPQHDTQIQPGIISRKPKRSRASLPCAFDHTKAALKGRVGDVSHDRSRHSLPTKSRRNLPIFAEKAVPSKANRSNPTAPREVPRSGRSTPQADPHSRLSLDGAASSRASIEEDGPPRTGDQFRDFCFAFKRTTSMTGSTDVDQRLPWPRNLAVRPSIDDAPKRRIDVLRWRDEL